MKKVFITKHWDWPDFFRQTQNHSGVWDDIVFTEERQKQCDYIIILNKPWSKIRTKCYDKHIWTIIQEPPNEFFKELHKGGNKSNKVFMTDSSIADDRHILSQPVLPWHVNKSYDELVRMGEIRKDKLLSFIMSNKTTFEGHKKRMVFAEYLAEKIKFDFYGKGVNFIEDKWDGFSRYKYSIALENFQTDYYWTEKIADCFLSLTVPIYYGCLNIENYFPANSFIRINISQPEDAIRIIKETIGDEDYKKRLPFLKQARELILNKYQFFPYISDLINKYEHEHDHNLCKLKTVKLSPKSY